MDQTLHPQNTQAEFGWTGDNLSHYKGAALNFNEMRLPGDELEALGLPYLRNMDPYISKTV